MGRLSRTNNLRVGIILMVTGIIALAHVLLSTSHYLGTRPAFIIGQSELRGLRCPRWAVGSRGN